MMKRIADASPRFKARIAGVLSLFSLLAAVFGEFIVPRFEIAGDLLAVSGNIVVTLLLYDIFKPVNRSLSLVAASFNLVGLTCGALRWNPQGVDIPVVLNGFSCLLIGYLIFRSIFLPRILGVLMAFAGLGWVTYLAPSFAKHLSPYNLALGLLGQESLMLWLLVMGVNVQKWKEQARAPVE
jgi:Domain of unknown function (DUF4386)